MQNYICLIIMTLCGSVASMCLKKASASNGLKIMLKNYNLYLGGILYILSAIINIILLRVMAYSIVLPLTSITYIWTMILSYVFFREKIGVHKIIGVLLICMGAILLTF